MHGLIGNTDGYGRDDLYVVSGDRVICNYGCKCDGPPNSYGYLYDNRYGRWL